MTKNWRERVEIQDDLFESALRQAERWAEARDREINADRRAEGPRGRFWIGFDSLELESDLAGGAARTYHFIVDYKKG